MAADLAVPVGAAGRAPERRMRLLPAAAAAPGAARPCASACPSPGTVSSVQAPTMCSQRLRPHVARRVRIDVEALELGARRRAAGAELDAAVAQEVEHRDRLGRADRMVVRLRQEAHAVADADVLGARGDRAVEDLGVRAVRVLLEEVMLDASRRCGSRPGRPGSPARACAGTRRSSLSSSHGRATGIS